MSKWNIWFISNFLIISIYLKGIFPTLREFISTMGSTLSDFSSIAYMQSALCEAYYYPILIVNFLYYLFSCVFINLNIRDWINLLFSLYIIILMGGVALAII